MSTEQMRTAAGHRAIGTPVILHADPAGFDAPSPQAGKLPLLVAGESAHRYLMDSGALPEGQFSAAFVDEGDVALERLLAGNYALLVASLSMPGVDGWSLLAKLRGMPSAAAARLLPVMLIGRVEADAATALAGLGPVMVLHEAIPLPAAEIRHRLLLMARTLPPGPLSGRSERSPGAWPAVPASGAARNTLMTYESGSDRLTPSQSRLLAEVTHELRTPAQGIVSLADLALKQPTDTSQRECLELVKQSAEGLLSMVGDILDHARAEARCLRLKTQEFSVRECVADSLGSLSGLAQEKGLQLTSTVVPEVPERLLGDPSRLRQVLLNLLGNAIKFTDRGEVGIHVATEAAGDLAAGKIRCRFSVCDSGVGIPPAQLAQIFEPFHQAGDAAAEPPGRNGAGVGLGLSIARQLVELMDGRIWVESRPGEGSRFHFTACFGTGLPATGTGTARVDAGGTAVAPGTAQGGPALAILLADDDLVSRRFAEQALSAAGHRVTTVADGSGALDAIEHGGFDVVLMDVRMPGITGIEATRRLRSREAERGDRVRLPVVIMTAHVEGDVRERCLAAGADDCLTKPVAAGVLCRLVARLAEAHGVRRVAVDVPALLERTGHDRDFLREMAAAFDERGGRIVERAHRVWRAGDIASFAERMHALRGMLGSLAAPDAAAEAEALERLARAGDLHDIPRRLASFECRLGEVGAALRQLADVPAASVRRPKRTGRRRPALEHAPA